MVRGSAGEDQKIEDVLASSREDARERNHPGVEASQVKPGTDTCSLGSSESPALSSGFLWGPSVSLLSPVCGNGFRMSASLK